MASERLAQTGQTSGSRDAALSSNTRTCYPTWSASGVGAAVFYQRLEPSCNWAGDGGEGMDGRREGVASQPVSQPTRQPVRQPAGVGRPNPTHCPASSPFPPTLPKSPTHASPSPPFTSNVLIDRSFMVCWINCSPLLMLPHLRKPRACPLPSRTPEPMQPTSLLQRGSFSDDVTQTRDYPPPTGTQTRHLLLLPFLLLPQPSSPCRPRVLPVPLPVSPPPTSNQ